MDQHIVLLGTGNTIVIVAGSEQTSGAFALLDYELAPGFASLPMHRHLREDVAIYVLQGRLRVQVGPGEHEVGQGEFLFLPKGIGHSQVNHQSEPARFLTLLLPAGFERCFAELERLVEEGSSFSGSGVARQLECYGVQLEETNGPPGQRA
jgi:quercetin dioxygenase-like cupin family protein